MALLVLGASAPLLAQSPETFEPAFSADDDLDCAIFVGALMAEMDAEMTPDNRVGLTSAFTYFVGRYEAQRGIKLTEAFTARYPVYLASNPAEIEQTCSIRMRAFGARLQAAGSALSQLQPSPASTDEQADTPPQE
ncbi:hypothetical protein [Qipengyuania sp. ASV99]|uniref:hypothetical protein n=1 Tax=Qipengyuania sp. ASV99 TaxID=3399681 RepID=UPI003A4C508A